MYVSGNRSGRAKKLFIPLQKAIRFINELIELSAYSLLPNVADAEIAIYFEVDTQQCWIETLTTPSCSKQPLENEDLVEFNGRTWRIKINTSELVTKKVDSPRETDNF